MKTTSKTTNNRRRKKMLKIRFTFNAVGRYKDKFTLCRYDSVTQKRSYTFADCIFPTPCPKEKWDEKKQKFNGNSFQSRLCNKIVANAAELMGEMLNKYNTAAELLKAYKLKTYKATPWERDNDEVSAAEIPTLGQWVEKLATDLKKENSTNHQLYNTLANKLRGKDDRHKTWYTLLPQTKKGELLRLIPLNKLNASHFEDFGRWINTELGGNGYKNLMTTIKAAYNKARTQFPNFNLPEIKIAVANPNKSNLIEVDSRTYDTLSRIQLQKLETADLSGMKAKPIGGISFDLTRDILMLQYYCLTRPTDAITFKATAENAKYVESHAIIMPEGKLNYIPYKKRNYANSKKSIVTLQLQPKALNIVKKYEGMNANGYIFPLEFLSINWGDVTKLTPEQFNLFESQKKAIIHAINTNFKRICEYLGIPTAKASMYTMRHTAITKQVTDGVNTAVIAKSAGTSIAMIEKHYLKKDLSAFLSEL